jgi:hypothetical protein
MSRAWRNDNLEKVKIAQYKYDHSEIKSKALRENSKRQRETGYQKQWQHNNKDKLKEYNNTYSNKAHKINNKEWVDCKEYFDNSCAYCGMSEIEHKEIYNQQLHKEHVDCNGSDDLGNCVPSCKRCNTSKHQFDIEEWYKKQEFFSEEKLDKIYKWLNEEYKLHIQEHKPKQKYTRKNSIHIENTSQIDV